MRWSSGRARRPRPARAARPRRFPVRAGPAPGRHLAQPNNAGSVWVCTAASSASGMAKQPSTTRLSPPTVPMVAPGTPCASRELAEGRLRARADRHDGTPGRLAEQGGERVAGQPDHAAGPAAQAGLGERDGQPAVGQVVRRGQQPVRGRRGEQGGQPPLGVEVGRWRTAAQVTVAHVRPGRAAELRLGPAEQHDAGSRPARQREPDGEPAAHVVVDAEHSDDRGGVNGRRPGLVVEADVPAGDRHAEGGAAVREPAHGLGELPHHRGVLRRAEIQAVRHGQRARPGRRHVPVGLGQRQLGAQVGVEPAVAAVAVGGQRDAEPGRLVHPEQAAVFRHGQHGVAADVPVVLVGDPALVGQAGRAEQGQQVRAQARAVRRAGQRGRVVGGQRVLVRPGASPAGGRPGRRPRRRAGCPPPSRRARS